MSFEKSTWRRAAAATTAAAFLFGGLGGSALPAGPVVSPIEIAHDPLTCVNTDFAPKVDAAVAPGKDLDKSYVYFKAAGEEDFYYAVMKGAPEKLEGVLPRPLPETRAIDYKIRATDVRDLVKEKGEFTPPVVPGNACKAKGVPVGKEGAGLTIGLTRAGQNPVPRGFNRRDIAFVILFGGATVSLADALKGSGSGSSGAAGASSAAAGGATGASAGAGISTGVAVGVGAAVAAGAAIVIVNNNRGSSRTNTPTVTPTFTPSPTRTFTPTPAPRFIEADATWSGIGNITVEIRDPGNQVVGTNLPAGCESTASRTERVILQGALAPGTYRVLLTASDCPPSGGAPPSIAAAVTVQSDSGPKCPTAFKIVPLGTTVEGCSFTVP